MIPNVLSIAGSDPSGGAGIQADLKTFAAHRTYGCAVVTALTVQNTHGVLRSSLVEPVLVAEQIDAIFADIRIDAVKIGMTGNAAAIQVIADGLRRHKARNIVVDPVMVSTSGHVLLSLDALDSLKRDLLPLATVITPNIAEAALLLGNDKATDLAALRTAAAALSAFGPRYVYLKGGHLSGDTSPDVVHSRDGLLVLPGRRIAARNTHGTGCTLSSSIAARLAHGDEPAAAFAAAKAYVARAIETADELYIGTGRGPLNHFHTMW